jgi:hypothetical protein
VDCWLAKAAWHRSISSLPVALVAVVALVVYVLHQDFWFWRSARPLVFGFLPVGLAYHAAYTLTISLLMFYLVRWHWPSHLEADPSDPRGPRL